MMTREIQSTGSDACLIANCPPQISCGLRLGSNSDVCSERAATVRLSQVTA